MQWPPTPGPGMNFMNPNGLVAAASMTSHTLTPSLSHTIGIALTSPMFTLRNVFSRILTSSAASVDETGDRWAARGEGPVERVPWRGAGAQVRNLSPRKGRRHANGYYVRHAQSAQIRGRREVPRLVESGQMRARHVLHVRAPLIQSV